MSVINLDIWMDDTNSTRAELTNRDGKSAGGGAEIKEIDEDLWGKFIN